MSRGWGNKPGRIEEKEKNQENNRAGRKKQCHTGVTTPERNPEEVFSGPPYFSTD